MDAAASNDQGITLEELQLAARNHGMPLEGLGYDITPAGLHYLLIHFDIPQVDASSWRLSVAGNVGEPLTLTLADVAGLAEHVTRVVTLECAGNGRARLTPRPQSQPWLNEAVGTAGWTGVPLGAVLDRAGLLDGTVEIVFTGLDRGVQGGIEHDYERSLTVAEASRPEVLLAFEMNGRPLLPQHGYPLRLLVPGWYGMTSVKWLTAIIAVTEPFEGYQQAVAYHVETEPGGPRIPVTRMNPRALMIPPGIPDFFTRTRILDAGRHRLRGRAWSGWAAITRVEVSADGGASWSEADLSEPLGPHGWSAWTFDWDAEPGDHDLCARATDGLGSVQPIDQRWTVDGVTNNMAQRVQVSVRGPADI